MGGGAGEEDVTATLIELACERIKATHRPVDLRRLGVLLQPCPTEIAGWLLGGEQPCGAADVIGGYPGELLRPLRGIRGGQLLEQCQGWPTFHHLTRSQSDGVTAKEGGHNAVLMIAAVGLI